MNKTTDILSFIERMKESNVVVFDVRSENEFAQGHIPGAISFPLLNNEARVDVGITYKQKGQQAAVIRGFELVGGLFAQFVIRAKEIARDKEVLIYCWRGGMRSNVMSWVLGLAGLKVTLLKGGYKTYRGLCLQLFQKEYKLTLLAGPTGTGKSELLQALKSNGQQVIDLEGLANHKGSSFGGLGQEPQTTQEQFENLLAWQLNELKDERVWLEDESRFIGKLRIPDAFFSQKQLALIIEVERSEEDRCNRILSEYGHFPKEILEEKTRAITKRMGGDRVKEAVNALQEGNMKGWLLPLLDYYDRAYAHTFEDREKKIIGRLKPDNASNETNCRELIKIASGKE